jgi:hypothetical protein
MRFEVQVYEPPRRGPMSDAPSFSVNIVQVAVDDVTEFTCTWRMR